MVKQKYTIKLKRNAAEHYVEYGGTRWPLTPPGAMTTREARRAYNEVRERVVDFWAWSNGFRQPYGTFS